MKLKALLLGSAAAFSVVGGAQAADLAVAEPVSYVRVCDGLYGAGFFYIPGSDTCVKITAYAQVTVGWVNNAVGRDYSMVTEAGIGAVGMWNGAAGEGSLVVKIKATDDATNLILDKGYFTFGGLIVGFADSAAKNGGALDTDNDGMYFANWTTTQIGYRGSAGPVGFGISVEKGAHWTAGWGNNPDIAGYVSFNVGGWALKVSGLIGDTLIANPYGFSVGATGSVGAVGLQASFQWANGDAQLVGGTAGAAGDSYSWVVSAKIPVGAMSFGLTGSGVNDATGTQYLVAGRISFGLGPNVTGWVEGAGTRNQAGTWAYGVRARLKAALPGT